MPPDTLGGTAKLTTDRPPRNIGNNKPAARVQDKKVKERRNVFAVRMK